MMPGFFSSEDLTAIWLTLQLACVVTIGLLLVGTPIAWWLARTSSRWKRPVAAIVALPLVLLFPNLHGRNGDHAQGC